jgi:hypothetical protein
MKHLNEFFGKSKKEKIAEIEKEIETVKDYVPSGVVKSKPKPEPSLYSLKTLDDMKKNKNICYDPGYLEKYRQILLKKIGMCMTEKEIAECEEEIEYFLDYYNLEQNGKSGSMLYTTLEQRRLKIDTDEKNDRVNKYDNAEDTSTFDSYITTKFEEFLNESIKPLKSDKSILNSTENISNNSKRVLDYLSNYIILLKEHNKEFCGLFGNPSFKYKGEYRCDNWVVEHNGNKFVLITAPVRGTSFECDPSISEDERIAFLDELKKNLR